MPDLGGGRADHFDSLYGLEVLEHSPDLMRGRVAVTSRVRQPFGLVHGGVYATMGESLASIGTHLGVADEGMAVMGLSNSVNFVRPIADGNVNATAVPRHRGRTTWVWDVEITDDQARLCAIGRVTIAVRPADRPVVTPPPPPARS